MRTPILALLLVLGVPAARAQPAGADAGTAAPVLCDDSRACAIRDGYGSVCAEGQCQPYQDKTDIFVAVGLSEKNEAPPEPFKPLLTVLPVVGSNPTQGALIGVAAILGIYLGDPKTTTISNISANVLYTTKNQFLSGINSVLMLSDNSWQLQGDWRFLIFNQDTFGLGTGQTPISTGFTLNGFGTTTAIQGAQPMDLNLIRIRENFLKRVTDNFYIGPGFNFDRYYAIHDLLLDLNANPQVITSHYAYSKALGFNPGAYNTSGPSLNLVWDSRDSTINPYRGLYASLSYQWYPHFLGSAKDSSLLQGEVRGYVGLDTAIPRNVLAFWVLFQTTVTGQLPYLGLPAIGWDARNRSGRGYVQGRFRGTAEVYAEAEYRFRITENGLLGGVVFANVETFSSAPVSYLGFFNQGENLFQNLRPAGGIGLRFMMNRQSRTNITLDLTVAEKTFGLYFGAGEAF
jgi:surface antigen Omp85-like protein